METAGHVWLIGGTSESAQLAVALSARQVPYVVSVTTEAARKLYPKTAQLWVGKLTPQTLPSFITQWNIRCILDASHPFATEISVQAMSVAEVRSLAYLRYERAAIADENSVTPADVPAIVSAASIEALLTSDILWRQRVLFTVGYRHLAKFAPLRSESQLFARVLPSVNAISGAVAAGFTASEIMAMRPPVSAELEAALCRHWRITRIVAKASGLPSGDATKRKVAALLVITLVLLQRPQLTYPQQTNSMAKAVEFCLKTLMVY